MENKFQELMSKLSEIYNQNYSKKTFECYWNILKSFSFFDIEQACHAYVHDSRQQFMPKPADILKNIVKLKSSKEEIQPLFE